MTMRWEPADEHPMGQDDQSWTSAHPPIPLQGFEDGYVGSQACRDCHMEAHQTWHSSFHRTMTQRPTSVNVLGDFDDVSLELRNSRYRLSRDTDGIYVTYDSPPWQEIEPLQSEVDRRIEELASGAVERSETSFVLQGEIDSLRDRISRLKQDPIEVTQPIRLMTGSHHYQVYWYEREVPGELHALPFVHVREADAWIPRESVFIRPPGPVEFGPWNNSCIKCHTTHGKPCPDFSTGTIQSRVAELGITCESCHGPGDSHVRWHQASMGSSEQARLVIPNALSQEPSSQVCGQCHSVSRFIDEHAYWERGSTFRPGDNLNEVKYVERPQFLPLEARSEHADSFWPDGVVRLVGREYNGLVESPCYQRGHMSCYSCHQLHNPEPVDQLAPGMNGNQACLQCHAAYRDQVEAHSHHPLSSPGSQCLNCHMNHTTFGLLKAERSHTIESPSVRTSKETGRPNACNQCHQNKSLAWADEWLVKWYGHEPTQLDVDESRYSAMLLWGLRGDAAQRALVAWSLGWQPGIESSGVRWQVDLLLTLMDDPYDAVRYVAVRSLRRHRGFASVSFDFLAPSAQRVRAIEKIRQQRACATADTEVLQTGTGRDLATWNRLLEQRSARPVYLAE